MQIVASGLRIILVALSLSSCCRELPSEKLSASSDGKVEVWRDIYGHCGGAKVGYRGQLMVRELTQDSGPRWHNLFHFRGRPRIVARWTGLRSLELDVFLTGQEEITRSSLPIPGIGVVVRQRAELPTNAH